MAFGIGVGDTAKIFLTLFSLAAGIGLFIYLYKLKHDKFIIRFALALIIGGAIGNFIDRAFYGVIYDYAPLLYGRVVDFLDVDFFDFTLFGHTYNRWPIFNIADTAVTLGVFILIFSNSISKSKVESTEDKQISDENSEDDPILAAEKLNGNDLAVTSNKFKSGEDNYQSKENINGKDNFRKNFND